MDALDREIEQWRSQLLKRRDVSRETVDDLEAELRSQAETLVGHGLDEEEVFLVALKRIGEPGGFSTGLVAHGSRWNRDAVVAVGLAIAAAVVFRIPELFGLRIEGTEGINVFYFRNAGFFVLPFLGAYFAWKTAMPRAAMPWLVLPFVAGVLVMNGYPFTRWGHTQVLATIHVFLALWLAVGFAYCGSRWRNHDRRLDFIRFSGEWFVHYVLIALGGGVFTLITVFIFESIGLEAEHLLITWIVPGGAAGAVIIAAWLADGKQGFIGNIAPVLTMLFTPLFTLALLVFLGTVIWTGRGVDLEREVLIGFDLLLVLVLGLVLYAVTARDPQRGPGFFDALQLVLLLCALVVDALALWAILGRISTFGFSPNRMAGLGLNIVMVVNLGWAAVLQARFLTRRGGFGSVLRWQTAYLPVFAAWAWVVVLLFPPLFGFV